MMGIFNADRQQTAEEVGRGSIFMSGGCVVMGRVALMGLVIRWKDRKGKHNERSAKYRE